MRYVLHIHQGLSISFSSVQSLRRVRLFATPWVAARQASLSITKSIPYIHLKPTYSSPLPPLEPKPLLFCPWITAVHSYLIFSPTLKPLQPHHHSAGITTFLKQVKPNHSLLKPTRLFNMLISYPSGHRWANNLKMLSWTYLSLLIPSFPHSLICFL